MARISIPLEASWYDIQSFGFRWRPPVADRPEITGDIAGGAARFLEDIVFRRDRSGIVLNIAPDRTTAFTQSGNRRLSSDFETSGSIAIEFNDGTADRSWSIDLGGRDTSEPYLIDFDANSDEDTAFDALAGTGSPRSGGWLPTSGTLAATLILDDGQPELAVDAEPAAVTVPAPTVAGIEADVESPALLPYTLNLGVVFATANAANWSGTIPAAYVEAAADQAILFEYGLDSDGQSLSAGIHIGGSSDVDLIGELEAARLKIQSADGATTYAEMILADTDPTEPYQFSIPFGAIQSESGNIRLLFERAADPVNADLPAVAVPAPTAAAQAEPHGPLPVNADLPAVTVPAPSAAAQAEPHGPLPVNADPAAVTIPAPSAAAQADAFAGTFADAEPAAVTVPAPTASSPRAQRRDPTGVDAGPAVVTVPAPSAAAQAEPHSDPVDVAIAAAVPAPAAAAQAAPHILPPVDADMPAVTVPAPAALSPTAVPSGFIPKNVQLAAVTVPAPTAVAQAAPADPQSYAEIVRSTAPERRILTCVEISHPAATGVIRLVDDGEPVEIAGETYLAARFGARVADDVDRRAPRGQLVIGNAGRTVSRWVEEADGGTGGTARVFEIVEGYAAPEWEIELDIAGVDIGETVAVQLGFDPLLRRPAVALRYDPQTAPGLF